MSAFHSCIVCRLIDLWIPLRSDSSAHVGSLALLPLPPAFGITLEGCPYSKTEISPRDWAPSALAIFSVSPPPSDYTSDGAFSETLGDVDPAPSRSARTPSFHSMPSSYDKMQGTSEAVPTPALSLEQRVEEQGHMLAELRSLMERLTSMERSATTSPSRRSGIPRPRLAEPPRFSGDRSEGRAFIDAISLYYLSADFDSDASAITWALGYFDSGCAQHVRREFLAGYLTWATWAEFVAYLRSEFLPADEVSRHAVLLETTGYYQGARTMDDYIDSFRTICREAGYPMNGARDAFSASLVLKFRRGMNVGIAEQIATSGGSRPANNDLEGWISSAKQLALAASEAKAFHAAVRAQPVPLRAFRTAAPVVPQPARPYAPPPGPPA